MFKIVILSALSLFMMCCSATKKLQAANILKDCKFTFKSVQVDSFVGDSLKFNVFLNVNNKNEDSLFLQRLTGVVLVDSLLEVPVSLKDSSWISSGNSQVAFSGAVQLDLFKLLALPKAKQFRIKGKAFVALKPNQESTPMDFDETRDIPPDLLEKYIRRLVGF